MRCSLTPRALVLPMLPGLGTQDKCEYVVRQLDLAPLLRLLVRRHLCPCLPWEFKRRAGVREPGECVSPPSFPFSHPATQSWPSSQGPVPYSMVLNCSRWHRSGDLQAPWMSKAGHPLGTFGNLLAHLSLYNVDYCGVGEWWAFFLTY